MPSPLPANPSPSVVVALTLTDETSIRRAAAIWAVIAAMCGAIFGRSATIVASILFTRNPFPPEAGPRREKLQARDPFELLVGVREVPAEVPQPGRSEESVTNSMEQDVGIGMAQQPLLMGISTRR